MHLVFGCGVFGVMGLGATGNAEAKPDEGTATIVSLGDSYISGEGGRWRGNSSFTLYNHGGTDRAPTMTYAGLPGKDHSVPTAIYGNSNGQNGKGCHRSDVAPIKSSKIKEVETHNLACSGSETKHVITEGWNKTDYKDNDPQIKQLQTLAQTNNIKMIVLSIGGNDLGFTPIIMDCIRLWGNPLAEKTCEQMHSPSNDKLEIIMERVSTVITRIKTVMEQEEYTFKDDYRIVLQSYPSPIPSGNKFRMEDTYTARFGGGCPFRNVDATWAHNILVPRLSQELSGVAADQDTDFLDLHRSLAGHEVCAAGTTQPNSDSDIFATNAAQMEWFRFVTTGATQGVMPESLHPNYYGQKALGRCLNLMWKKIQTQQQEPAQQQEPNANNNINNPIPRLHGTCHSTLQQGPKHQTLAMTPTIPFPSMEVEEVD